jgi:hypothetical protein
MLTEPTNTAFCCDMVGNIPLCEVELDMINFAKTTSFLDAQLENQISGCSTTSVGENKTKKHSKGTQNLVQLMVTLLVIHKEKKSKVHQK